MIAALAFAAIPLAWFVFALIGPRITLTAWTARKMTATVYVPRVSRWGNNPASQYVHEVGGWRFGAIGSALVFAGPFALLSALPVIVAAIVAIPMTALMVKAQLINPARQWIDLAEHGAEILHAERFGIDPVAAEWLAVRGFDDYRDAESWRMTRIGQEYAHLTPERFLSELAARRWASLIIMTLGRW